MSLFSAIGKGLARHANDKHAEHQRKKAKKNAYKKTGKEMDRANKNGKYINGSQTYKNNLNEENRKIKAQHKRNENFINDL